jgi:hypothetical protein
MWNEEFPCEVCGESPDECTCPECPQCGRKGDPRCYEMHGMIRAFAQKPLGYWEEFPREISEEDRQYWEVDRVYKESFIFV